MFRRVSITLLINTLSKPIEIGIYREEELVETIELEGQTSDNLLPLIVELIERYSIRLIIYSSGPGSHMSTKIAYVLLKSLNIIKDIPIKAVSGFELNGNKPIKALGKLYFIKEKETIITKIFEEVQESTFYMPKKLETIKFELTIEPNYKIAAV